jgi:RecB family endonuclease NucS
MNLLIPYVHLPDHVDPTFDEFTYADIGPRGRRLASLGKGDTLFFHTTSARRKVITAYYVVDRALAVEDASRDNRITLKYKNPHIRDYLAGKREAREESNVIVFGDPILSHVLRKPIAFDRELAMRLSLGIPFKRGRSDTQAIVSATRAWRPLSERDVRVLMAAASRAEKATRHLELSRSSEEVAEVIEKDIEDHLAAEPGILGKGYQLDRRQLEIESGRIDLLFRDTLKCLLVVEVKLGWIGRDAIAQVEGYIAELRRTSGRRVRGAIVCGGVMPGFEEDIRKKRNISVYVYGWNLGVRPL